MSVGLAELLTSSCCFVGIFFERKSRERERISSWSIILFVLMVLLKLQMLSGKGKKKEKSSSSFFDGKGDFPQIHTQSK